jgi:hypothetical protein
MAEPTAYTGENERHQALRERPFTGSRSYNSSRKDTRSLSMVESSTAERFWFGLE